MSLWLVYLIGGATVFSVAALVVCFGAGKDYAEGNFKGDPVEEFAGSLLFFGIAALFWPVVVALTLLASPFYGIFHLSARRHTKRVMELRVQCDDLRAQAKQWDVLAKAPEQTSDTKRAARAAAEALRGQADTMVVPKLAKQKS